MAGRFTFPRETAFDGDGNVISGAKLNFYETGTSTPQDTYSDDALSSANANPVVADSEGVFGDIFLSATDYKVVLTDADDVTKWSADPVRAPAEVVTTVLAKTTTYSVAVGDDRKFITADATGGAFVITLPAVADAESGFEVTVMKVDSSSNAVTVDGNGAETINGVSDLDLPDQYSAAIFRCNGSEWLAYSITPSTTTRILPAGEISGLAISNNGSDSDHDIDIATGECRSDDDTGNIILSTALTKRGDASFAEGDDQGGMDTGSIAADTLYFVYAIGKTDGTADVLFTVTDGSPTMPSGFTLKRKIGILRTDASANFLAFTWLEDGNYYWGPVTIAAATTDLIPAIPSGTKKVELCFKDVSLNNTDAFGLQLGDSGGIETSGYEGTCGNFSSGGQSASANSAMFFITNTTVAAQRYSGIFTMSLIEASSNTWSYSVNAAPNTAANVFNGAGQKALSAELSQAQWDTSGAGTFDDGEYTIRFMDYGNPRSL
jgi:hypothetical protein